MSVENANVPPEQNNPPEDRPVQTLSVNRNPTSRPVSPRAPPSRVNVQRSQPISNPKMQRQMGQALQRAARMLPSCRQGEAWIYVAAYVAFYTLVMLFRMSTIGFLCIMVYTILITCLVLKYYGHGPLVYQPDRR